MQVRGQSASRYPHHQRTQLQGTGCLFPRACLPACLSVSLSVCVSGHPLDYQFNLCIYLRVSGHPSVYLFSLFVCNSSSDYLFSLFTCSSLSICLRIGVSASLSVCIFPRSVNHCVHDIRLFACMFVDLTLLAFLLGCLFICLSVCLSICLSICLSACLSVCLCLPVCLPVCLSACLYGNV